MIGIPGFSLIVPNNQVYYKPMIYLQILNCSLYKLCGV